VGTRSELMSIGRSIVGILFGVTTIFLAMWLIWVLVQAPIILTTLVCFPFSLLWLPLDVVLLAEVHLFAIILMGSITSTILDGGSR